jgi:hypothetical protein
MDPAVNNSTAQTPVAQTDVNDDLAKALASVQAGPQENMDFEPVGEPATAAPQAPVMSSTPAPAPTPAPVPSVDDATQPEYSTPPATIDHTGAVQVPADNSLDAIEQIKISALQELRPLMQHIDLSPEERFEKYLMMLRASDDATLIQPTYEAAQKIAGEKLRAQALLDVINEINYLNSQQLVA